MVQDSQLFGLPRLEQNPFSTLPLESGDVGKLIGRNTVISELKNYLKFGSARRILLVGPLGSGRTSLTRCLTPYASKTAFVTHLPSHAPAKSLLDTLYNQLLDLPAPNRWDEVVKAIVDATYASGSQLPMIVIDVPSTDISTLNVALRNALSVLERLRALVILVCDHKQRQQLPSELSLTFDEHRMEPWRPVDVQNLIQHRLASIGYTGAEYALEDARTVLEQTDGYPSSVLTLLRNSVDNMRMGQSNWEPSMPDTSARLAPRDGPSELNRLMELTPEPSMQPLSLFDEEPMGVEATEEPEEAENQEETPPHDFEAAIIDASLPWTERTVSSVADEPEASAFGNLFDLDMDSLDQSLEKDEPLQPAPFATPIIDASEPPRSRHTKATAGGFFRLANRNKDTISHLSDQEGGSPVVRHKVFGDDKSEYWVAEDVSEKEPPLVVSEEESAALIHDEIGLPSLEEFTDDTTVEDLPILPEYSLSQSSVNPDSNDLLTMLSHLLSAVKQPASSETSAQILRFFEQRQREHAGPKEQFALDTTVLNSLNSSEAYVVSEANERAISPSDSTVLQHLGIKRARLSQICSRLLKAGILQVRQVGRRRMYEMTQSSRAQLMAWGAMKEGGAQ